MLPMIYADVDKSQRIEQATEALVQVGLSERIQNRPNQLSGGQQQRVALAKPLRQENRPCFSKSSRLSSCR
jgi:putative ABC transport system ATP-binding protein